MLVNLYRGIGTRSTAAYIGHSQISELDTFRKISWKFQLNPLSHLGGILFIRFDVGYTYRHMDGQIWGDYKLASLAKL